MLDEARLERIEQWREVTGELRAIKRSTLASEEEGLIVELLVEEGDAVEAGQTIARLKDTLTSLRVRLAEARIRTQEAVIDARQAELDRAERDLRLLRELATRGSAKQNEVDDAETAVATAAARLKEAESELRSTRVQLELEQERLAEMVVHAPFGGAVVSKLTEIGEWAQRGDPIIELIQTNVVEVWLDVPERFVDNLSPGSVDVQVRIEGLGEVREATVQAVIPLADSLSRLFPVRVRLDNEDGRLKPGMSAVGLVPTGVRGESLTIHKDAILRNDAGTFVYFAQETPDQNLISAVAPVEILFAKEDRVSVRSPLLQAGSRVVIEGNERMFPGQPLIVQGRDDDTSAQGDRPNPPDGETG